MRAVPGHGPHYPRRGELAMASGRPRRPNDPSVMASVESALRAVPQPGLFGLAWQWRYELGLVTGLAAVGLASGYLLSAAWFIAIAVIGLALFAGSLAWPPSRRRLIARTWCIITPHRVRTGCAHAWVQTRNGRLPTILYTTPAAFGERVTLWCRAGISHGDLRRPGTCFAPRAGPGTSAWWPPCATRTSSCWRSSGACPPDRRPAIPSPPGRMSARTTPTPGSLHGTADRDTTARSDK
jgi:hypothetical protein